MKKFLIITAMAVLFVVNNASAQVWYGDFRDGDLKQYWFVDCGGPCGSCPSTSMGRTRCVGEAWRCPGIDSRGRYETTYTISPLDPPCSNPELGCRFEIVDPPRSNPPWPKEQEVMGPALKVLVKQEDGRGDGCFGGDRNELVYLKEDDPFHLYYVGEERYYNWNTLIPEDFPEIDFFDNNAFHVLLQFHQESNCQSPPIEIDLKRESSSSTHYQFQLGSKESYELKGDTIWRSDAIDDLKGRARKGQWHSFVLHVYWDIAACSDNCDPTNPDGGLIELWFDGVRVWPPSGMSPGRKTLYLWPKEPCPYDENPGPAGTPMRTILRTGLYRNQLLRRDEIIYHNGLKVTTYCEAEDFWGGRPGQDPQNPCPRPNK